MPQNLTIGLVRFSYLHVFEPTAMEEGQQKKYSVSVIIPKKDKELVKKIKAAIEQEKEESKSVFGGKVPANLKTPLRDGDIDRSEDEAYKGCYFMTCNSNNRPGIVNAAREPIISQDEIKSGDYGYVSVSFFAFNKAGNKGIAAGLNHIMKTKTGEALAGGVSVEEAFEGIEVDEDADDLLG